MSTPINQHSREADIRDRAAAEARQHLRDYWERREWCKCSPPVPGRTYLGQTYCSKCQHEIGR